MSYGTSIRLPEGRVYLNRMALNSLRELKEKRDEAVKDVRDMKEQLKMLAAGTPKDLFPDENDILFRVNQEFEEVWDSLEDYFWTRDLCNFVIGELDGWAWSQYSYAGSREELKEEVEEKLSPEKSDDWWRMVEHDYDSSLRLETDKVNSLETFERALDQQTDRYMSRYDKVADKYVLYFKGRLFSLHNGHFLFSSKESAIAFFFRNLGLEVHAYDEKAFVEKNKDFIFNELKPYYEGVADNGDSMEKLVEQLLASDDRDYEIRYKLFHKIEMALHNFILQFVEVKKVVLMPDKEQA